MTEASEWIFGKADSLAQQFKDNLLLAEQHNMAGTSDVNRTISDSDLVKKIRSLDVRFGSNYSAAYHMFKHPMEPAEDYITRANIIIRTESEQFPPVIKYGQEGDCRIVSFRNKCGRAFVMEKYDKIFLLSCWSNGHL